MLGAAIGAAGQTASSLISGIFGTINGSLDRKAQNENIDKQIAAQAAENQKTREYNLNLAKMQNQWNLEQWNRENEYNTPKAQMQRLADAGLNPDLFYQNGVSGMTAASSPSMTAGAPATPQDMSALGQKKTVGQALNEGLQSALIGSQIRLTNAQADKTEEEAEGQGIKNSNIFDMDRAQIENLLKDSDLKDKQIDEISENVNVLKAKVEEVRENVEYIKTLRQNASEQQTLMWLNYEFQRQRNEWRNKLDSAQYRLLNQQWSQSKDLFRYIYKNAEVDFNMSNQLWQDYLAGKQHYASQMFGGLPNWLKGTIYTFDVISGALTPIVEMYSTLRGKPAKKP